jgi:hypothetical protein
MSTPIGVNMMLNRVTRRGMTGEREGMRGECAGVAQMVVILVKNAPFLHYGLIRRCSCKGLCTRLSGAGRFRQRM